MVVAKDERDFRTCDPDILERAVLERQKNATAATIFAPLVSPFAYTGQRLSEQGFLRYKLGHLKEGDTSGFVSAITVLPIFSIDPLSLRAPNVVLFMQSVDDLAGKKATRIIFGT